MGILLGFIDLYTLIFVQFGVTFTSFAALHLLYKVNQNDSGIKAWRNGALVSAVGTLLLALFNFLPLALSVIPGVIGLAMSYVFFWHGIRILLGNADGNTKALWGVFAITVLLITPTVFIQSYGIGYGIRVIVLSFITALFCFLSIHAINSSLRGSTISSRFLLTGFWGTGSFATIRMILTVLDLETKPKPIDLISFFVFTILMVVLILGLVILLNERMLKQLKESKQEAEKANKRKTRFLASASHDLRQPIHALELFSEALTDEVKSTQGKDNLSYLKDSISSLNELLTSLLDISRLDAGIVEPKFEKLDISSIIWRIAQNSRALLDSKGLELRIRCQSMWIYSDRTLLANILGNLLNNAIKYTDQGGVLISCRYREKYNQIWLEIWDTGIGIPEKEMMFIRDEFYQVNNAERDRQQGLGLGLSIVSRESKILDHSFEIYSRLGRGTLVRLKLKKVRGNQAPPNTQAANHVLDRLVGCNILIIDDDELVLMATKTILKQWGCNIRAVCSLEDALLNVGVFSPDVIISDFRLKQHVTGIDVIERLRQHLKQNVAAILMTGDTAPDRLKQAKNSGLTLLHKPVKPARLRLAVNSALNPTMD